MNKKLFIFALASFFSQFALANNNPPTDNRIVSYDMNNFSTDLLDEDVDYFSTPIVLVRNASTTLLHKLNFNVSEYHKECVASDSSGNCTAWDYYATPIQKVIELDLSGATPLTGEQQETFELVIQRTKPMAEGVDDVRTFLNAENVLKPVVIIELNDYRYIVKTQ